jgi:hypothetical protein
MNITSTFVIRIWYATGTQVLFLSLGLLLPSSIKVEVKKKDFSLYKTSQDLATVVSAAAANNSFARKVRSHALSERVCNTRHKRNGPRCMVMSATFPKVDVSNLED